LAGAKGMSSPAVKCSRIASQEPPRSRRSIAAAATGVSAWVYRCLWQPPRDRSEKSRSLSGTYAW
jgi:type II secretory pathway component PulM